MTPRELDARAGSQIGRSLFRPTIETALTQPNARLRAIASDDGTGHSLDTIELGDVLKKAHEILDRPLDLLGMDACLMSCLEVAYQAEKDVRAVVSSEELEPGDGWPYDKILADLRSNPAMDGAGLGARRGQALRRVLQARRGHVAGHDVRDPHRGHRAVRRHRRHVHDGPAASDQGRRRRRRPGCCARTRAPPASTAT